MNTHTGDPIASTSASCVDVDRLCVDVDRLSDAQQLQLSALLDDYLTRLESGEPVDEQQFLALHPELREPLAAFLSSLRLVQQAADTCRGTISSEAFNTARHDRRLGDYRLLREVGRGGMGVVYEAEEISLRRRVALKLLPFAAVLDQKQIARFRNEAQAAAQLHHPHIVPVFAVGCERGVHYYAMQFVDGQPLDVLIHQLRAHADQPLPRADLSHAHTTVWQANGQSEDDNCVCVASATLPNWATTVRSHQDRRYQRLIAGLGVQMAQALQHAHDVGIVHRDIKPSNLLLDAQGKVWITDFGLAYVPSEMSMTATGDVIGTVRYMSPEQAAGRTAYVDHRTDVYSLGITLYELLTLKHAFPEMNQHDFLRRLERDEPRAPRRCNPAISQDLENIVLKAIAKEPARRYASAAEMADDLQRFLDGRPTTAQRPTLICRAGKWARRHRRVVAAAAATLMCASLLLLTTTLVVLRQQAATSRALATARENFQRAETNYRAARDIVDHYGVQLSDQLAVHPGTEPLRRDLLVETLRHYEDFMRQAADDPALQGDYAAASMKAATITQRLGDTAQALSYYDEACRTYAEVRGSNSARREAQAALARCLNNRGLLRSQCGQLTAALADLDEALTLQEALLARAPAAVAVSADAACTLCNRALVLAHLGRRGLSRQTLTTAIEQLRKLTNVAHDNETITRRLAISLQNLAYLAADDEPDFAQEYCAEALALQRALAVRHPDVLQYQSDLALSYDNLGALQLRRRQLDAAATSYAQAVAILERLRHRAPDVVTYECDLAVRQNNLGRVELDRSGFVAAAAAFEQAAQLLQSLRHRHPENANYASSLGGAWFNRGMALYRLEPSTEAWESLHRGIEFQREAIQQAPQVRRYQAFLDQQLRQYVRLLAHTGQFQSAIEASWQRRAWCDGDVERMLELVAEMSQLIKQAQRAEVPVDVTVAWEALVWELVEHALASAETDLITRFEGAEEFVALRTLTSYQEHRTRLTAARGE